MAPQYIYTMVNLRKVVPPQREILKGIYLSFFPGAKIGVLGLNGAGKSSLLRIMAGVDKDFNGEAFPAEGTRVGFLAQDPWLDPAKNVLENVEAAVAPIKKLLARFDELGEKMGESLSDDEMEKVMAEYGRVQDAIEAANGWDLDRTLETAMDALRCPPPDADVTKISGGERRRVALCRVLLEKPDLLLLDEPTNHLDAESVAWLEQHLAEYPGTVVAVTHDRYFLDNVAQWILELDRGAGIPWKGNYTSWLEQKATRLAQEEKAESAKQKTLERELEWVRMAPRARHAKGKARLQAYEQLLAESGAESRGETNEIYIPAGPAPRRRRRPVGEPEEGVRRQPPLRRPLLRPAEGRHRRRHRPERRRQDDPLQDDHGPRDARRRRPEGGRDGRPLLRRPEPRPARPDEDGLGGDLRRRGEDHGRPPRDERAAPGARCSTSRGPTSRSGSATSPAAR